MEAWLFDPWTWMGAGLVLLLAELLIPGYVMLSFGCGALAMWLGLLVWGLIPGLPDLGPASDLSPGLAPGSMPEAAQSGLLPLLLVWALLSGVAALLIWRFWRGRSRGAKGDEDVNDFVNRL